MDPEEIAAVLDRCERQLGAGDKVDLSNAGFWSAVNEVKRTPELVERFAGRIAGIDRMAFERSVLLTVPLVPGTILALLATAVGVALAVWSFVLEPPVDGILLLVGFGVTLVATHGLGHLVVGSAQGIRFTHWFVGSLGRPQPGVKVDYASYLQVPPGRRAWMHASGAIVSKLIPFLFLLAAIKFEAPRWSVITLFVVGVVALIIDALWSVKSSDWKKFHRERALAHG